VVTPESMQFATVPMAQFPLSWRFSDPRYDKLPPTDLAEINPLAPKDARQLWAMISQANLVHDMSLSTGPLPRVAHTRIEDVGESGGEDPRIREWLNRLGIECRERVWLSYQPDVAIETAWEILVQYWSAFYYPGSDDLTVVGRCFNWVLFFSHEEEIFFNAKSEKA